MALTMNAMFLRHCVKLKVQIQNVSRNFRLAHMHSTDFFHCPCWFHCKVCGNRFKYGKVCTTQWNVYLSFARITSLKIFPFPRSPVLWCCFWRCALGIAPPLYYILIHSLTWLAAARFRGVAWIH